MLFYFFINFEGFCLISKMPFFEFVRTIIASFTQNFTRKRTQQSNIRTFFISWIKHNCRCNIILIVASGFEQNKLVEVRFCFSLMHYFHNWIYCEFLSILKIVKFYIKIYEAIKMHNGCCRRVAGVSLQGISDSSYDLPSGRIPKRRECYGARNLLQRNKNRAWSYIWATSRDVAPFFDSHGHVKRYAISS